MIYRVDRQMIRVESERGTHVDSYKRSHVLAQSTTRSVSFEDLESFDLVAGRMPSNRRTGEGSGRQVSFFVKPVEPVWVQTIHTQLNNAGVFDGDGWNNYGSKIASDVVCPVGSVGRSAWFMVPPPHGLVEGFGLRVEGDSVGLVGLP